MASDAPDGPAKPDDEAKGIDLETALRNAEQFLVKSRSAIHPGLAEFTMLRYLSDYRLHLYAVVACTRREQGLTIGHGMREGQG